QTGGDILHTMDCEVDLAARQSLFNLLHKKPLAADHRQWRIQDPITRCLDAFQRYCESRLKFAQAALYPFGLPDGQGAPACPDDQLAYRHDVLHHVLPEFTFPATSLVGFPDIPACPRTRTHPYRTI